MSSDHFKTRNWRVQARRPLSLAVVLVAGCAFSSKSFMPAAPPDDERAVLAEFCAERDEPCQRFTREILPDPEVQTALKRVRFVQFELYDPKGSAAFEHFNLSTGYGGGGLYRESRILVFLALIGDRPLRRYAGSPFDRESLIAFIEAVAELGGSETKLREIVDAANDDPTPLARAARWYAAHGRDREAAEYWTRLGALASAPAELRAEADWHRGALARKGMAHDAGAALAFAKEHAGTSWEYHALAVAIVATPRPPELESALRASFERTRNDPDATNTLALAALAARFYDLALTIAQQGVRLTSSRSSRELETLAEAYFARHQKEAALSLLEQALAITPDDPQLRLDFNRIRFDTGFHAWARLSWQTDAEEWSRLFYCEQ